MGFKKKFFAYINSIKTKLIVSFLVITLAPLIYISYTLLNKATEGLLNVIVSGTVSHARKASIDFDKLFKNYGDVLQPMFTACSLSEADRAKTLGLIEGYDNTYNFIERIYILNPQLELVYASGSGIASYTPQKELFSALKADRPFVLGHAKIPPRSQESALLVKGLYNPDGSVKAYCIVELNKLQFKTILSENVVGSSTRAFLTDSSGSVIARFPEKADEADFLALQRQILSCDYGAFTVSNHKTNAHLVATYLPIVGFGWKIIMLQDQDEVYALVGNFQSQLYWLLFFTVIVALIIALTISQNIALPILQVTKSANELASGKYDVRIKVKNSDEVGQLASNFNVMADSLTNKMKELEEAYDELKRRANTIESKNVELDRKVFEVSALYGIGHEMGKVGVDIDKLMDILIKQCVEVANVERGYLLMMSSDLEFLELRRSYVLSGNEFLVSVPAGINASISVKPGEGITGKVVQTGQMMSMNDLYKNPNFRLYEIDNEIVFNLCCIPLKVNNIVLGVIALVNRRDGSRFEKRDTDLLQTMADQAALFLDNLKLFKLAITDGLTGLALVRHFKNKLNEEIKRAKRYKKFFSILFIDIDHFKKFNDTYGHQVGDEVLKQTAAIFRTNFRDGIDLPARYGGEEMIALLPETNINGAFVIAERIRKLIEEHKFSGYTVPLHVTVSVGLAEFPIHSTEAMGLIKKADTALYASKEGGRNRTTKYSADLGEVSEK